MEHRETLCDETYLRLFGQPRQPQAADDPDLMEILQRFIFGDVFSMGTLSDALREQVTCAVLTAQQALPQLKAHLAAALRVGVAPERLRETLALAAPMIGFPRTLNAMALLKQVLAESGLPFPASAANVTEETRFARGEEIQKVLYGTEIRKKFSTLPAPFDQAVARLLTEECFGDFYTRGILSVAERELISYALLAELGTEVQLRAHALGNQRAGNAEETLLAVLVQALPYTGFPKTLNAISLVHAAYAQTK